MLPLTAKEDLAQLKDPRLSLIILQSSQMIGGYSLMSLKRPENLVQAFFIGYYSEVIPIGIIIWSFR